MLASTGGQTKDGQMLHTAMGDVPDLLLVGLNIKSQSCSTTKLLASEVAGW